MQSKKLIITIVFVLLIVFISVVICLVFQKSHETERLENQRNYSIKCSEYNNAVDEYNSQIDLINRFIGDVQTYDTITETKSLSKKQYIQEDFSKFISDGANFEAIATDIQSIESNTQILKEKYRNLCYSVYDNAVDYYNELVKEYNDSITKASVDYILDFPQKIDFLYAANLETLSDSDLSKTVLDNVLHINSKCDEISAYYMVIHQITAPEDKWIIERLKKIDMITEIDSVSYIKDPGGLLGKEGGYIGCVYFAVDSIDQSVYGKKTIVAKGTDAGGSVEVYASLEDVKKRCEYLSQFDDTLLYSGSYVIVGTVVIRTSYRLSDQEQIDLTNLIVESLTELC